MNYDYTPPTLNDYEAAESIARILRDPEYAPGMLEDIAAIIKATGRSLANPTNTPTWTRH